MRRLPAGKRILDSVPAKVGGRGHLGYSTPMPPRRWDIFCKVIDNFGDIGVAWRLSRALAHDHGLTVRLWVDDPASFARIWPAADATAACQHVNGVEVRRWTEPLLGIEPADVVVETFQCDLPEAYVQAMAALSVKPRWINLDYLSAEDWVTGCHALPSPHPRLPLVKHFFFPGFEHGTGGLLLERGLLAARDAFVADPQARSAHWDALGLPSAAPDELRVSLFCYDTAPLAEIVEAWAHGPVPVTCVVPEGAAAKRLHDRFHRDVDADGVIRLGRAALRTIPFTDQDRYDRLLWACDVNFVRGEDSFVRAQWAQHPWVWHIYPQHENAHWIKLNAFLAHYGQELAAAQAAAVRDLWRAWNGIVRPGALAQAWGRFLDHRTELEAHGRVWARQLAALDSLVANLVRFCAGPI